MGRGGEEKGKGMGGKGREGRKGMGRERRGREGREGECEHAPVGIFESRRLCRDPYWTRCFRGYKIIESSFELFDFLLDEMTQG